MFLFSREFLENLDRRFGHVLALEGRDFVIQAKALFEWVLTEPRTSTVLRSLTDDLDRRAKTLRDLAKRTATALVKLRTQLEQQCPDASDEPVPADDDFAGHQSEFLTFRAFDKHAATLIDVEKPALSLTSLSNDLIQPLVVVLGHKRSEVRTLIRVDGKWQNRTAEQKQAIAKQLDSWDDGYSAIKSTHGTAFREATMAYSASGGRVVFLLTRYLAQQLVGIGWPSEQSDISLLAEREGIDSTYRQFREAFFEIAVADANDAHRNQEIVSAWVGVLKGYLKSLHVALRLGLDERGALVGAIQRYRLRSELHDVSRLREVAAFVEAGKSNQKAELRLTADLAKYLFDAGFDTFSEVTRGEGRADLVHFGGTYVEAKQGDGTKDLARMAIDAYWQAQDGIRQFLTPDQLGGVKGMVLAIFVRGGPRIELPPAIPARDDAVETFPIVIDLREAQERGSRNPKQALQCTVADFQARPVAPAIPS